MKQIMCIWFPHWPIQRRLAGQRADRGRAIVVYSATGRGKPRVVCCSRTARQRGVLPGMSLAEAQSLWPASAGRLVRFEEHDPLADRQALREMALWCQRFSPKVALDAAASPDCLLLAVCGVAPSARPQTAKTDSEADTVVASLARRGFQAVAVVADTIGAAWAVAHYGRFGASSRTAEVSPGEQANVLRPLPVEALRLPDSIVRILHELNIFRIDQLLALPRAQLPSRFGPEILLHIDRALGTAPEMLKPEPLEEPLEASWKFEYPIADGTILTTVLDYLLDWLLERIPTEHFGIQRLQCVLKLAGDEPVRFPVELLRPSASKRDLMELIKLQIERLRVAAEVSEASLQAAVVRPLEFRQDEMFGGSTQSSWQHEVGKLLERLSSRLGEKAVLRPRLWPDVQPEFAYRYEPAVLPSGLGLQERIRNDESEGPRPVFLKNFPQAIGVVSLVPGEGPRKFHWSKQDYIVERSWGPERIETGWWRGDDVRRDYFLVETTTGERFWMFRNLADGSWRLHGVFA